MFLDFIFIKITHAMGRIPDICGDGSDPLESERPEAEGLGKFQAIGQLHHDIASI